MEKEPFTKDYDLSGARKALNDALALFEGKKIVWPEYLDSYSDPRSFFLYSGSDSTAHRKGSTPLVFEANSRRELLSSFDTHNPHSAYLLYDLCVENKTSGSFSIRFRLRPYTEEAFSASGPFLDPAKSLLSPRDLLYDALVPIPAQFNGIADKSRQTLLFAKLIFLSMGDMEYREVSDLEMASLDYLKQKQRILNQMEQERLEAREYTDHPELPNSWNPRINLVFNIPNPLSERRLIDLFGLYKPAAYNRQAGISVCRSNIYRFAVRALRSEDFSRLRSPLVKSFGSEDFEEEPIREHLVKALEKITALHELGHHVFRGIANSLSPAESETLANWFASLFLSGYEQKLLRYLTKKQSSVYKHLIRLPDKTFHAQRYAKYCQEVTGLMREIAR